jgi:hypothetical protein
LKGVIRRALDESLLVCVVFVVIVSALTAGEIATDISRADKLPIIRPFIEIPVNASFLYVRALIQTCTSENW